MKKKIVLKNPKSLLNLGEFSKPPPRFFHPLSNYVLVIFPGSPTIPTPLLLLGTKKYILYIIYINIYIFINPLPSFPFIFPI